MSFRLIVAFAVGLLAGAIAFAAVWLSATGLGMPAGEPAVIVGLLAGAAAIVAHMVSSRPAI